MDLTKKEIKAIEKFAIACLDFKFTMERAKEKKQKKMIKNKVEVEIILTDKGNIKIASGGAIYSVERLSPLAAGLEVDLLYSLGIMDKMEIKKGDRVNSGGILGTVVEANQFNEFVTVLMDDDKKELSISRKYIETVELEK